LNGMKTVVSKKMNEEWGVGNEVCLLTIKLE
jgi:hypothetical protein